MAWDDIVAKSKLQAATSAPKPSSNSFVEGFFSSALSASGELFGMSPTLDAEKFRAENPGLGLVSEFISPIGIYGAAAKLSKLPKAAKKLEDIYQAAGGISAPLRAGALREMARFAPLEVARLGTGAVISDDYPALVGDVALSTGLAGAFGAVGGAFAAAGRKSSLASALKPPPGVDQRQLATFQYRAGLEALEKAPAEKPRYQLWAHIKRDEVFDEAAPKAASPTMEVGGVLTQGAFRGSRIFSTFYGKGTSLNSRRFNLKDFGDEKKLSETLGRLGLDRDAVAKWMVQPRLVTAVDQQGANRARSAYADMAEVAPGIAVAKEKDGLWLVARRVSGKDPLIGKRPDVEPVPATRSQQTQWLKAQWAKQGGTDNPVQIRRAHTRLTKQVTALDNEIAAISAKPRQTYAEEAKLTALREQRAKLEAEALTLKPVVDQIDALAAKAPQTFLSSNRVRRAKRTAERDAGRPGDEYLFFRTDDIKSAVPEYADARDRVITELSRMRPSEIPQGPTGSMTRDFMRGIKQTLSYMSHGSLADDASARAVARQLAKQLGGGKLAEGSRIAQGMEDFVFKYIKPATFQESRNPVFARSLRLLRAMSENAEAYAQRFTAGVFTLDEGVSGYAASLGKGFKPSEYSAGIRSLQQVINDLDQLELNKLIQLSWKGVPVEKLDEMALAGEISEKIPAAARELEKLDAELVRELNITLESLGLNGEDVEPVFRSLKTYRALPRMWNGDFRTKIYDEAGDMVALGSGKNVADSEENAKAIVDWLAENKGIKLKVGETGQAKASFLQLQRGAAAELFDPAAAISGPYAPQIREATASVMGLPPKRFSPRADLLEGYPDWAARGGRYTHEDVIKSVFHATDHKMKYLGYKAWEAEMADDLSQLAALDEVGMRELMRRADDIIGVPGPFAQMQNDVLDSVLAPVIGMRSASKIAAFSNKMVYWFTLGLMNPTFAILNALTPLQTVTPWLSFVQHAPEGEVQKIMGWLPVMEGKKAFGQMGYVHPLKLMYQSSKLMGRPDEELRRLFGRAATERVLTSQITEELVGAHASVPETLRTAFKQKDYVRIMEASLRWLPEKSEAFARTFAFTANVELGRRVLGLTDEALYQFAKRSTEVTMINYATVDRARIITGPIGSMLGLFKNWQMHYIGMMARYAGVGLNSNQWGPLLWMTGSTAAVAGVGGTPLAVVANGLAQWHDNKLAWELARDEFNSDTMADGMWYGLPGLMGVSMQASAGMPGTDINRDVSMMFSSVHLDRGAALGKAVGSAWEHWSNTGESPFRNENVRDQVAKAVAPRFFYRAMAGLEGDYIKSMQTGYPLLREVTPFQRAMYATGLNPTTVDTQFEIADRLWKTEEEMKSAISSFGAGYAEATLDKDYERARKLLAVAQLRGVPIDRMMASAATRMRREEEDTIFSKFSDDTKQQLGYGGI